MPTLLEKQYIFCLFSLLITFFCFRPLSVELRLFMQSSWWRKIPNYKRLKVTLCSHLLFDFCCRFFCFFFFKILVSISDHLMKHIYMYIEINWWINRNCMSQKSFLEERIKPAHHQFVPPTEGHTFSTGLNHFSHLQFESLLPCLQPTVASCLARGIVCLLAAFQMIALHSWKPAPSLQPVIGFHSIKQWVPPLMRLSPGCWPMGHRRCTV